MALIIPVTLHNGDIEDADEVMENFDYIADHAPSGPASTVVSNLAAWNDTTGTTLMDSGIAASQVVVLSGPTQAINVVYAGPASGAAAAPAFRALVNADLPAAASVGATPADPSATTNTTGVMMGLAVPITPTRSGKLHITATFEMESAADSPQAGIRHGTGTAPVNGAALTGTAVGKLTRSFLQNANELVPASCVALVTGLTLNTAVWLDLSLKSTSGGSVNMASVSIVAIEL